MIKREKARKNRSYADVLQKAYEVFGYNNDKALMWYMTKQPYLNDKTPFEFCREGGCEYVWKYLNTMIISTV